jgi:hypothetical protein
MDDRTAYTKITEYLKDKDLKSADKVTTEFLFPNISFQNKNIFLEEKDIEIIDVRKIRLVDSLWNFYSNGKFGFKVQELLYYQSNIYGRYISGNPATIGYEVMKNPLNIVQTINSFTSKGCRNYNKKYTPKQRFFTFRRFYANAGWIDNKHSDKGNFWNYMLPTLYSFDAPYGHLPRELYLMFYSEAIKFATYRIGDLCRKHGILQVVLDSVYELHEFELLNSFLYRISLSLDNFITEQEEINKISQYNSCHKKTS